MENNRLFLDKRVPSPLILYFVRPKSISSLHSGQEDLTKKFGNNENMLFWQLKSFNL